MKLKKDFKLVKIDNKFKILNSNSDEIKTVFLSEFGAFLWDCLSKDNLSSSDLLNKLLSNFEISTVLALGEIDTFIKICKENGIFE